MMVVACRAEGGLKKLHGRYALSVACALDGWMDACQGAESVNLCCLAVILRIDWVEAIRC